VIDAGDPCIFADILGACSTMIALATATNGSFDHPLAPFKPGNSFVIGFYGVSKQSISGNQITDYNPGDVSPPGDKLSVDGPEAFKMGECDLVEIVWRSDSGAQGQVLQSYQVPGTECV